MLLYVCRFPLTDIVLGVVLVEVDTANVHWGICRRSRDDDLLGSSLEVETGLLLGGEDTGGLDDVVSAGLAPGDGSRVLTDVRSTGSVRCVQFRRSERGIRGSNAPSR